MFDGIHIPDASSRRMRCRDLTARAMLLAALRRTLLVAAVTLALLVAAGSLFPAGFAAFSMAVALQ